MKITVQYGPNDITYKKKKRISKKKKRKSRVGYASFRNMKCYVKKEHLHWFALIKALIANYNN